ncbi:MAG: hypothetical protein LBG81_01735 [Coriobacteriaceae bacterium]|jgi:hypothetical protein|nr:hypothetical protein [Coriobacteriaceae bacterium]
MGGLIGMIYVILLLVVCMVIAALVLAVIAVFAAVLGTGVAASAVAAGGLTAAGFSQKKETRKHLVMGFGAVLVAGLACLAWAFSLFYQASNPSLSFGLKIAGLALGVGILVLGILGFKATSGLDRKVLRVILMLLYGLLFMVSFLIIFVFGIMVFDIPGMIWASIFSPS